MGEEKRKGYLSALKDQNNDPLRDLEIIQELLERNRLLELEMKVIGEKYNSLIMERQELYKHTIKLLTKAKAELEKYES